VLTRIADEASDEAVVDLLDPDVAEWFLSCYGGFTPPQRYAVKEIHEGRHTLISSPTGTGKTLSAFLAALNELVVLAKGGRLEDRTYVLYVSPLKALNSDVERNLNAPLDGILSYLEAKGVPLAPVRVAVRTGDTTPAQRQAQTRKPPHLLITTPESLALLLNAPKMREHLRSVRYVVVDELHALADTKRGAHLALSLERLENLCAAPPVRVGLSATIAPLEAVARFLVGDRDCRIADVPYRKEIDLQVVSPVVDLVAAPYPVIQEALYKTLGRYLEEHRTVLIFTNTRAGTERVVHQLKERYDSRYAMEGAEWVAAHHGSMARERRLEVEGLLKHGALRCVVTSTSLELGIDIGSVDLVVLLGSPKGIARALQRVGRAGHQVGAISKGRLVVMDRDDLVECTVLAQEARERRLDRIELPHHPLDVLCQHLIGMSLEQVWSVNDAFAATVRAGPYLDLSKEDFVACLRYLAGEPRDLEARRVYGKIWYDEAEGRFGKRGRMARALYSMNVGVIPDTAQAHVMQGTSYIGSIDEDFLENLVAGDIFTLGGHTWEFRHARGLKAQVSPAPSRRPTVPAWVSEQLPLSWDLAAAIGRFRDEMAIRIASEPRSSIIAYLRAAYHVDGVTAEAIFNYFTQQARFAIVPTASEVLVEEIPEDDRWHYVFHSLAGRRVNDALARAFARIVSRRRRTNVALQVGDNGFVITVPRFMRLAQGEVHSLFFLPLREVLQEAIGGTEIERRRFRHVATRSFLILRRYLGRRESVGRDQVNAQILLKTLQMVDPGSPVLREMRREIFEEAFDVVHAEGVLNRVVWEGLPVRVLVNRHVPSPFAFGLITQGRSDAVAMEDRKEMVRQLHARVLALLDEEGGESRA